MDLAEIRASTYERHTCAMLLLIEGVAYGFVSNHYLDVLRGSGASSWIGQYEGDAAYTDHETTGQRIIVGGLQLPREIRRGQLNPNTGILETTQLTFEIQDVAEILPTLFAPEGKDEVTGVDFTPVLLAERVPPGTTALDATLQVGNPGSGSVTTIDPAGLYLGIERLGPARERRWFFPFPFQGIGLHHHVHADAQADDGPPIVQVSSEPIVWAGRTVALYRLYRDPDGNPASYTSWPHLGEQYTAGALEWWGVLQDRGEYDGKSWRIQAFGPESLLRRRMATIDAGGWWPVNDAAITLSADERRVGVSFHHANTGAGIITFNSTLFTSALSASGTRDSYATELADLIRDVGDGTLVGVGGGNVGFEDNFLDEDFGSGGDTCQLSWEPSMVSIRRCDQTGGGVTDGQVFMTLAMHSKLWRLHGFDPELQHSGGTTFENEFEIEFDELSPSEPFSPHASIAGNTDAEPGVEGFIAGTFFSRAIGSLRAPLDNTDGADNDGGWRRYRAMFQIAPLVLTRETDQIIRATVSFPYLEGDPTVASGDYDRGRWFAIKGMRAVGTTNDGLIFDEDGNLVEDVDAEEETQAIEVYWDEQGTTYGSVTDTGGSAEFVAHKWLRPRRFGIDRDKITGEWAALSDGGEMGIFIKPMHAYAYREDEDVGAVERSWATLAQLLLSTGTAGGWQLDETYEPGENAPAEATGSAFWANDIAGSEMGLGIPHQLVQSPDDLRAAFDVLPDGADGGLNRARYVFGQPFQSTDLIEEILRPRWLAMTLRGGRYSVARLVVDDPDDVEHTITESSIAVSLRDPSTAAPVQAMRPTGALDAFKINLRRDPTTDEFADEWGFAARDPSARLRRGDVEEQLTDGGLFPASWNIGGATAWRESLRQTLAHHRATWAAKRHYAVKTKLLRTVGQDVWPGDRVRFTNRRVYANTGVRGVTGALGVVTNVTWMPHDGTFGDCYEVEILIYADQDSLRIWAPIAKIVGPYAGGDAITLEADADFLAHGEGDDGTRFLPPSWVASNAEARVCILEYDRTTWTLHSSDSQTVASATGTTVTLSGAFSTTFHAWTDKYLVLAPFAEQDADSWPLEVCLPVLQDDLTHSSGEPGLPFVDG